jgi:hypothetical protein
MMLKCEDEGKTPFRESFLKYKKNWIRVTEIQVGNVALVLDHLNEKYEQNWAKTY